MNEQNIPAEWERVATKAIAKQRRVDQLLRQPSKDEWFAKAVIDDLYPLIAAAERAQAARDVADEIMALAPGLDEDREWYIQCAKIARAWADTQVSP